MNVNMPFFLKTLLLLWVFCAVMCEHHKRDVHRIVIKERIPRSHKKGYHSHSHHHDHSHNHGSRSRGHRHKKTNKYHSSSEDASLEDENDRSSSENSFENVFPKHKGHKSYRHHHSKKSYNRPPPTVNQEYETSKQEPYADESSVIFRNEWLPMSLEHLHHSHQSTFKEKHKKRKENKSKKYYMTSLKPPPIEITTSYPFQFEASSMFPQLNSYPDAFSNYNLNNKIIEANQFPLIGTIEQPNLAFPAVKNNYDALKNHINSYEVTELNTAASNINTLISVPDESNLSNSKEEVASDVKVNEVNTQKPSRVRGTYRGSRKY